MVNQDILEEIRFRKDEIDNCLAMADDELQDLETEMYSNLGEAMTISLLAFLLKEQLEDLDFYQEYILLEAQDYFDDDIKMVEIYLKCSEILKNVRKSFLRDFSELSILEEGCSEEAWEKYLDRYEIRVYQRYLEIEKLSKLEELIDY